MKLLARAISELSQLCNLNQNDLKFYYKALLNRGFGCSAKSSHERIHIGDIVQVLLRDGHERKRFLSSSMAPDGQHTFFVVGAFIKSTSRMQWAVVKQCTFVTPSISAQLPESCTIQVSTPDFYDNDSPRWQYLQMVNQVRKVGHFHDCTSDGACEFSNETQRVKHSKTTLNGGLFFLITKQIGYPPRRS